MVLKNKNTLNVLIIIVMILVSISVYFTYASYQTYTTVKQHTKISSFVYKIESTLGQIAFERIDTAKYLATKEINSLEKVKQRRKAVDRALSVLENFVVQNSQYTIFHTQINDVRFVLKEVRKEVDEVSEAYRNIFVDAYHIKVFGPLIEILKEITAVEKSKMVHSDLAMYVNYTILKENNVLENTGIHFVLYGARIMSKEDRVLWAQLVDKDTLPNLDILLDKKLAAKISELLSAEKFKATITSERDMIRHEARKGNYSVSITGWANKINTKMDYFKVVQALLREGIHSIEQEQLSQSRLPLMVDAAIMLILLFRVVLYLQIILLNLTLRYGKRY